MSRFEKFQIMQSVGKSIANTLMIIEKNEYDTQAVNILTTMIGDKVISQNELNECLEMVRVRTGLLPSMEWVQERNIFVEIANESNSQEKFYKLTRV